MSIQDTVELHFSRAEIINFSSEEDITIMHIIFGKSTYEYFADMPTQRVFVSYLKDHMFKLIIDQNNDKNTFSLVDTRSAETVNIDSVKFVNGNFQAFLAKTPVSQHLDILISGLSKDGSTMVFLPATHEYNGAKIYGYSYIGKNS